ncbi:hypothetical protein AB9F38_34335, partial [Rhizobium leguminosarum]
HSQRKPAAIAKTDSFSSISGHWLCFRLNSDIIIAPPIEDAAPQRGATLHCAVAKGYAFITMNKYGRT